MGSFSEIIQKRTISEATGLDFVRCSVCDQALRPDEFYVVAKAFDHGRIALEAAQCISCQMDSKQYASEQSMENIMLYSGRRFQEFMHDTLKREVYHLEDPSCLITGELLSPNDSFELYSFNVPGVHMEEKNYLFIGPTAMEQMSELLSQETRKSWGRFTESLAPQTPDIVVSPMFLS